MVPNFWHVTVNFVALYDKMLVSDLSATASLLIKLTLTP